LEGRDVSSRNFSGGTEENHEIPQNLSLHVTDENYNFSRTVSDLWELESFLRILYILEGISQFISSLVAIDRLVNFINKFYVFENKVPKRIFGPKGKVGGRMETTA
jgi:hypothetical protein